MARPVYDKGSIPHRVTLYPREKELIEGLSRHLGLGNFSGSLRYIINEWARQNPELAQSALETQPAEAVA